MTRQTFYVSTLSGAQAVSRGLRWLAESAAQGTGVVVVPTQRQFRGTDLETALPAAAAAFDKGRSVRLGGREIVGASARTFPPRSWSGGPVLLLWPSTETLQLATDDTNCKAICAIHWGGPLEVRPMDRCHPGGRSERRRGDS